MSGPRPFVYCRDPTHLLQAKYCFQAEMDFPGHFEHIFQQLNYQRVSGQLCDCVIVVGGQPFKAHRSILAACSTHFRALLNSVDGDGGGGEGSRRASMMELDPDVVTPEAFSALLEMIYTSTLTLGNSNVMDVLLAASHLHLNTVVKACKQHLTSRNFPTSPPRGWRSPVPQQQFGLESDQQQLRLSPSQASAMVVVNSRQQRSVLLQQLGLSLVTSALEGSPDNREIEMGASQTGDRDGEVQTCGGAEQQITFCSRRLHKRKNSSPQVFQEERLSSKQRGGRSSEETHSAGSPRVTRSHEGEELPSPDSLKTDEGLRLGRVGTEEVEEKYETGGVALQGEAQLPSQSDGSEGGRLAGREEGQLGGPLVDRGLVFKVKVGDEGHEEDDQKTDIVVKDEQLSSSYPDTPDETSDPPPPPEDTGDRQEESANDEKEIILPKQCDPSPSIGPQNGMRPLQNSMEEDGSSDEGLDSNPDLGLSCILNQRSVLEAVGEDGLLTTSISEAQAESTEAVRSLQGSEGSSSLMFPIASGPFQQILAGEGHNFSDSFILQPTQTQDVLGGFLRGVRPDVATLGSLSLTTSHSRSLRADIIGVGGISGAPAYRRIAPKVTPNSEAQKDGQPSDASSSGPADAAPRAVLTRASEDVRSKCKKALTEHNVLVVEGARKYACQICCKTFLTLTDCKKHIRVHTGEKPYACLKCGKRFSQSSHLYKHSKTLCLRWKNHLPATLL